MEPRPIARVWRHRIAQGKLTLLVGDPGHGKSLLTADLAARISAGALAGSPGEPRSLSPVAARLAAWVPAGLKARVFGGAGQTSR